MAEKLRRLWGLLLEIGWAALVLLLPVTSLPILSRVMGGTMVAPASLLPLGFLGAGWFIFFLLKKGKLPGESLPLLLFGTIALIASAGAFFLNIPTYKHAGILGEEAGAIITLLIGLAFYAVTAGWLAGSSRRLVLTLKTLSIGGTAALAWAAAQGFFIYFRGGEYPGFMEKIESFISFNGLFNSRMTGMAFEPSWMAHQLNMIFLPFWLAATVTGFSAFRFRLWKISVENILLAAGVTVLILSSRVGMFALLLVAAFLVVYLNVQWIGKIHRWMMGKLGGRTGGMKQAAGILLAGLVALVFLGAYAAGAVAVVYAAGKVDPRLARIFQVTSLLQLKSLTADFYTLANYLQFAERVVYWQAGWGVFQMHPLLGVGLGNAGFFFQQTLPGFSWNLPEVLTIIYRAASVPNVKSFWVRLLAETGITGFSAFAAWLVVCFGSAWKLRRAATGVSRAIGWGGVFVIIAFLFEGFSVDTFALPYLWVSLGMVSAAAMILRRGEK